MKDMHSNIKVVHAITPAAVGTSGIAGGKLSAAIDRRGYDSVEFVFGYGTSASAADTITPVVYEGDATGGGWDEADDHVKRRGLAGAIGAEESDDFAGAEVNADASNDGARAE